MRDHIFASCAPGLEGYLLGEARALKLSKLEAQAGGVAFMGDVRDTMRANLHLRTASRVLVQVSRFQAPDEKALYEGSYGTRWERFLGPEGTFKVHARCRRSALDHAVFISQRVKDGVADRFREKHGVRPSVDKVDPDVRIEVHLSKDRCTLSVDSSGDALHRRGWRRTQGVAPLKENVAAACVMASGWDRRSPLLDPFCGSGTILVEAAMLALGIAPGIHRERFAFQRWPGYEARLFRKVLEDARKMPKTSGKLILRGWDSDPGMVRAAMLNLESVGLADRVSIEQGAVADFRPRKGWNAFVVTNPPYGERVGDILALKSVYRSFGEALRAHCAGYSVAVLSGNPILAKAIGVPPRRMIPLKNGDLDCQLLLLELRGPT